MGTTQISADVFTREKNGTLSHFIRLENSGKISPNCGVELAPENKRSGRKCKIPSLIPNGRRAIQTLRKNSFQINGARLFNCLPKKLREIQRDQDFFKSELDKFLETVPDELVFTDSTNI